MIYPDLSAAQYHADRPTLSSSIARILIAESPAHAWTAHPKLNPDYEPTVNEKFDVGTCAHSLLLEGEASVVVIDAPDWRTKAAKEERDAARAAGQTPLLLKDFEAVERMVAALRAQCDGFPADPPLFADGVAESVLVWEEAGVLCKARLDWLRNDRKACDDLKTTSRSANPDKWIRSTMWSLSAHIQAAFYGRGLRAVLGVDPEFRFCVFETSPPYGMSVVSLAPSALELANAQIDYALDLWKRCLENDEWPSYPQRVCYAEAPSWEMTQWMEREAREELVA